MINTPNGYEEMVKVFGDITKFVRSDGLLSTDWETDELDTMTLPFPIKLAWNMQLEVTRIKCHRLLVGTLHGIFQEIVNQNLLGSVQSYGGCYNYRPQRGSHKLSSHAWGIALDLNVQSNEQGTTGNMSLGLVEIFTNAGFVWGGTFSGTRIDPQHFQFVSNY